MEITKMNEMEVKNRNEGKKNLIGRGKFCLENPRGHPFSIWG